MKASMNAQRLSFKMPKDSNALVDFGITIIEKMKRFGIAFTNHYCYSS